jgi:hypothetical protein
MGNAKFVDLRFSMGSYLIYSTNRTSEIVFVIIITTKHTLASANVGFNKGSLSYALNDCLFYP